MEGKKELEVLIVEDDLIVSRLHKFSINGTLQNDVQICENGKEAIEYLDKNANQKEKFLILLDLNMPKMNGWEFLDVCHRKDYCDKLVVVIITSSSYKEDNQKALNYDRVVGYYTKPLKREYIPKILEHPEISRLAAIKN